MGKSRQTLLYNICHSIAHAHTPAANICAGADGSMTDTSEEFAANCCGAINVGVAIGVVWAEADDTAQKQTIAQVTNIR